eukprot:4371085-Prymnesium_polylepis.1
MVRSVGVVATGMITGRSIAAMTETEKESGCVPRVSHHGEPGLSHRGLSAGPRAGASRNRRPPTPSGAEVAAVASSLCHVRSRSSRRAPRAMVIRLRPLVLCRSIETG